MQAKTAAQWLGSCAEQIPNQPLQHLQIDSRKVSAGDVFFALPGHQYHGNRFIGQALAQGAALVMTDQVPTEFASHSQVIVMTDLLNKLPELAAEFYQHPANRMQLIAVTGTNGKSSTSCFIQQLAQQLHHSASVIGTLGYGHPDKLVPLSNTTPHAIEIQRILAELANKNSQLVAMEVSSHALVQQRVDGLNFKVAVFTNLSRDHLDYHGSMAAYGAAKARLFTSHYCQQAVINVSDAFGAELAATCQVPVCAIGTLEDCCAFEQYVAYSKVQPIAGGFVCTVHSPVAEYPLKLALMGAFSIDNALAAIAALSLCGYSIADLCRASAALQPIPGRMEQFYFPHPLTLVVDFAHSPDALQLALTALRPHCHGHLWCVFGCGGDRDQGKRPLMAQAAEQFADRVVITSDNPRHEDANSICQQIAAGMSETASYQIEPNREYAIKLALSEAQSQDMILVAGKGHETFQQIGDELRDYDERAFIRQLQREMSR